MEEFRAAIEEAKAAVQHSRVTSATLVTFIDRGEHLLNQPWAELLQDQPVYAA